MKTFFTGAETTSADSAVIPAQPFEPFPLLPGALLRDLDRAEQSIVYRVLLETQIPESVLNADDDSGAMHVLHALMVAFQGNDYVSQMLYRQWSDAWDLAVYAQDFIGGYARRARQ